MALRIDVQSGLLKFYLVGLIIIFCTACMSPTDEKQNQTSDIFAQTQKVNLRGESTTLLLPHSFKRTSLYRIETDIPHLRQDSIKMQLFQQVIKSLEFKDAEIDIFFDTTNTYRLLLMTNTVKTEFNKELGNRLNSELNSRYKLLDEINPQLSISKVDSKMKQSNKMKMMKFKHGFKDANLYDTLFHSIYFITTDIRSLVIYETSFSEEDIEDYLWSIDG